jgi:hypothetical protein
MLNLIGQDDIFFCNNLLIFISSSGLSCNLSISSGINPDCWPKPWEKTTMPSAYILLLIVSLAAVWIYWQTSQDIFVLVALAGLGCFIWGFSWAPWSVQLLIVVLLLGLEKCYLPNAQSLE